MKISMYSIVIFCFALCFSGRGMENSYSGAANYLGKRPLKITITNDDLDEDAGSHFKPLPGNNILSIGADMQGSVIKFNASVEVSRTTATPLGISVYGQYNSADDTLEAKRVSAIFPKKGSSVEMIYEGRRDKYFDIRLFYAPDFYESSLPSIADVYGKAVAALNEINNKRPAELSRAHIAEVHFTFKPDSYQGLVFNGKVCPSGSKLICYQDHEFKYVVENCETVSSIDILLDKSSWTQTNFNPKVTVNRTSKAG